MAVAVPVAVAMSFIAFDTPIRTRQGILWSPVFGISNIPFKCFTQSVKSAITVHMEITRFSLFLF